MKGKKKKGVGPPGSSAPKPSKKSAAKRAVRLAEKQNMARAAKEERRAAKLERRLREKRLAESWDVPAPAHLVGKGKLEKSKVSSKYHSYFEFAENTEKKDKKLEFQVTDDARPPPGFKFVPIGDPTLTNACKELSRARDAMIFIVSASKEENLRIKDHVFRIGYHFRESIVDEAREIVGETAVSNRVYDPNDVEPIPESQEEINKQADGAIRDLFPRIPNTDRQMVIDHAFKKGALFHGEPTVGLQPGIPLSRRVQLAVLAHIRHTHTRYDLLLRETTWMNARKVVEPVCLDVLVRWRGDEETGRDQMEEILREVVVITDSEDSDESSEEEDSSDEEEEEEGEVSSASSASISLPNSRNERRSAQPQSHPPAGPSQVQANGKAPKDKKAQRGFKRYQAAWDEALTRQQGNSRIPEAGPAGTPMEGIRLSRSDLPSPHSTATMKAMSKPPLSNTPYGAVQDHGRYESSHSSARQDHYYAQLRSGPATTYHRDEVIVRPLAERPTYHQSIPRHGTPSYAAREQGTPVLVRASPTSNGLQDLLVPSIETASSDALFNSTRPDERHEVYGGQQQSYPPRDVERRRQSPASRQVILINDDSPQLKRRRVVYEDGPGHFRPVPSRDQDLYSTAPRAESHLSSAQSGEFLVRRERLPSHSSQGLSRVVQPLLTGPIGGERLPIYDAPPDFSHTTSIPDRYRRVEVGHGSIRRDGPPMKRQMESPQPYPESRGESSAARRPTNGHMRAVEHNRIRQMQPEFSPMDPVQRTSSPAFPVSRVSRPHETGPEPAGYQAFVDNFSQSRLDPPLPRARDDFTVVSERFHHNFVAWDINSQRYEDRPVESFTTLRSAEARPPVQYVERPVHIHEERAPIYYSNGQPAPDRYRIVDRPPPIRERPPPEGDSPQYIRTIRRPIIELE